MPGKKQKAKERLDKFYELAKTMGYRSRASFKLVQLNKKYDFLSKAKTLVDLCAAPGSWSQVAAKEMPAGSTIIGVDLVKIAPLKGCKFIQGDIFLDKTRNQIKAMLDKKKCEVVIHDGAPNVGGTYAKDAFNQNALTLKACKLACELLLPDGWFVTKVFRSTDSDRLTWVFKQLFEKVEQYKPAASRQQSAEVFVVCGGFKAPKRLDADLFSIKTVFEEINDEQIVDKSDPTLGKQGSKKNQGYNLPDGRMLLYEKVPVSAFLEAEDPKQFLNVYNEITWEGDEELQSHKLTNFDVKECFKDLKVISQWDQNKLIKWAKAINRERNEARQDDREAEREAARLTAEMGEDSGDDDEKIGKEIDAMHKRQEKAKKRQEKKMIDRKLTQAERLGYDLEEHADGPTQNDFYEFSKSDLVNLRADVDEKDYDENADIGRETEIAGYDIHKRDEEGRDLVMNAEDDDDDEDEDEDDAGANVDFGGDDEEDDTRPTKRSTDKAYTTTGDYYKSIERLFDNAYRNRDDYESDELVSGDESADDIQPEKYIDTDEEEDSSSDDDDEDSDSIAQERKVQRTPKRVTPATGGAATKKGDAEEEEDPKTLQQALRSDRVDKMKAGKKGKKTKTKKGPGGFEEIPTEMLNPDTRAKTLAIAQQMLESKKRKREILEDGIHRYCFPDDGLPKWFLDEERRHNIRPLPITKAEVDEQVARFKEVNARPSKKVAEAIGRRRKRAADKLKRIMMKEKADPRLKGTTEGLTVRKMARSKDLRRKKEKVRTDGRSRAEERGQKKKAKFLAKTGKGGGGKGKGGGGKRKG
eukprot:TRINITY_DN50540_c0_g1_i1.p1 TRINITY_DN50540_c0_g1~~TRINITY_DN50540_c0_g1_i1.p1  ORF type:complete len:811 (+),score=425.10 TRINITY_DN50540_c0_g1_i1:83-2515(+)